MAETKHTPGEWLYAHRCDPITQMYYTDVFTADGGSRKGTIATFAWYPMPADETGRIGTYREANARLTAAAPALLQPAPDAADLLEQYANFIRTSVRADDLERHPYLPLIEQTAADLRSALALAVGEG